MPNRLQIAALAVAVLLIGCGRETPKSAARTQPEARIVRVVAAAEKEAERTLFATGVLAARDQAALSVKVAGRLEDLRVDVGTTVKAGETIGQIQKRDYELKVQQAKAALSAARARLGLPLEGSDDSIDPKDSAVVKEARAQLDEQAKNRDRIAKLFEQKILSQSELETAESAYQVAVNKLEDAFQETNNRRAMLAQRRAELNIAEQQLADTLLRAPFDGVIQERKVSPGEYLMEGAPLVTLVRIDPIRLRLDVPEREALPLRRGQRVRFRVDPDTNTYTGQIDRLSPAILQDSRMLQVEADFANDGKLRPGAFVRAEIVVDNVRTIAVPRNAVIAFAGIEKVFIHEKGKAIERRVTTGPRGPNEVEIVKGLKAGDAVILEPGGLRNEQPVIIDKESTERVDHPVNG